MELPRSTYYDQLEKGTLITADNLQRVAANLGINRAELLTLYRLIDRRRGCLAGRRHWWANTFAGVLADDRRDNPLSEDAAEEAREDRQTGARSGRAAPVALLSAEYDPPGLLALAKRRELALEIAHQLG